MGTSSSRRSSPPSIDADDLNRNRILSSKLYFDVPPSKVPLIYSPSYDIEFLGIEKLFHLLLHFPTALSSKRFSTISYAAKLAFERGWSINVGGGFHHCSANKGGGFCAYADISLCIKYAFVRLNISRVIIIDLDAHQGNGHATDFCDERVYILDMYNSEIYPLDYEARRYIDQKLELVSGTRTQEYLELLDKALKVAKNKFDPELVIFNAGTDILDGDPLGNLKVSPDGVVMRDEMVFRFAKEASIPIVMLTSGGYTKFSARVIADSIINLSRKGLIDLGASISKQ
ncbi:hypothetical protein HPP92_021284 [Vanilla planifolia]|uniref:Histone deacetylase domain-containing protein n=1 Tax=Vanilla planifolia TaxID=51239 RepID=A0A835Q195_VANPL|nr:hypothetical protein HPP92_021284 [Vanilla planifolia]